MTANAFGVHQCTVSKIIILVCDAINKHVGPAYLHLFFFFLPQDKDEMIQKVSDFLLKTPRINSQDYSGPFRRFSMRVWQNARANTVR